MIQNVGRTPRELFESEEATAMRPLPVQRWDQVTCKELTVGPDWRVLVREGILQRPAPPDRHAGAGDGQLPHGAHLSGVPGSHAHQRAKRPWEVKRKSEHAPPELEQYLSLTSEGLVQWAQRLGPSVALVAELILADRAVDGLRPVRALIRLADTYTTARLEVACRRAVRFATPTYRSVKDILAGGLDRLPEELPDEPTNKYGGRVVARVQLLDDAHVSSRRGGAAKTRCSRVCRATPPAFFSDWLHAGRGDGRLIPTRRENAVTRSSHADSQDCGNDVVTAGGRAWTGRSAAERVFPFPVGKEQETTIKPGAERLQPCA